MKKMYILLIIIVLALACNNILKQNIVKNPAISTFQRLAWLEGNWERKTSRGSMHESWAYLNDSTMQGTSFVTRGIDTVSSEHIILKINANEIQYIPTVRDQNIGKVVLFTLKPVLNDTFVFENLQHDFPQRILYWHPHPDSLYAAIEGMQGQKMRQEQFVMAKKE